MKRAIRVLLADEQTMFREGLAEVLTCRAGMAVVGQTVPGPECVALAREAAPEVVVVEVGRDLEQARRTISGLLGLSPPPKVAVLSMFGDPGAMRALLELGINAYLLKSSSVEQLIGVIRAAILTPSGGGNALLTLPRGALGQTEAPSEGVLSERETEALLLAARGLSNRQIATSLRIAESTVKRHLVNVYAKMEVGSRAEATSKALSEGWFSLADLAHSQTN